MSLYDDVYRESLHDWLNEDRRRDAEMEAWDDEHPADTTCGECGAEFYGNWTRGSRIDPPEARNECPYCR